MGSSGGLTVPPGFADLAQLRKSHGPSEVDAVRSLRGTAGDGSRTKTNERPKSADPRRGSPRADARRGWSGAPQIPRRSRATEPDSGSPRADHRRRRSNRPRRHAADRATRSRFRPDTCGERARRARSPRASTDPTRGSYTKTHDTRAGPPATAAVKVSLSCRRKSFLNQTKRFTEGSP